MRKIRLWIFLIVNTLFAILTILFNYRVVHPLVLDTTLRGPGFSEKLTFYMTLSIVLDTMFLPIILGFVVVFFGEHIKGIKLLEKSLILYWFLCVIASMYVLVFGANLTTNDASGLYRQLAGFTYVFIGLLLIVFYLIPMLNAYTLYRMDRKKIRRNG